MKVIYCLAFASVGCISAFKPNHAKKHGGSIKIPIVPLSRTSIRSQNDLFDIDNKLNKLTDTLKELKKKKLKLLSGQKGLKLVNETEIEKINHKKIKRKPKRVFEEENESEYYPQGEDDEYDDEDDDEEPQISGIQVIFTPPMMASSKNERHRQKENDDENAKKKISENFEIVKTSTHNFTDIGGYQSIKDELMQCADMLIHYDKYKKYNVRVPKGIVLEGPPGNGKTLLAKCFAGQINVSFIPVSGSQFQEKYVGVGSSRVRELFELAKVNVPCIIFIDEMDAIGRKRSSEEDGGSNSERDATLNELLVSLDGFKNTDGIFIIGATNRVDLLDKALIRPGRIDKSIYIGLPDEKTREAIIDIHVRGKPLGASVTKDVLIEMTQGLSGAQIENLLNEAMLYAIRNRGRIVDGQIGDELTVEDENTTITMEKNELEMIFNRILVGTQSTENLFTEKMLYLIAIHEMGHAICGLSMPGYNRLIKVSLNSWSHKAPGFTLFEIKEKEMLHSKPNLISHLAVLLAGRIAEEEFFGEAITTGASKDLEEVKKLAYSMITEYGMGTKLFYPVTSDKSKEMIDKEVNDLVEKAYLKAHLVIVQSKKLMEECARVLMTEKILTAEFIEKKARRFLPNP